VIGTKPEITETTVRECEELGVKRVWMHQPPFGPGSVSQSAAEYGREHGMTIITGGCPCMFNPTADPGHKLLRAMARPQVRCREASRFTSWSRRTCCAGHEDGAGCRLSGRRPVAVTATGADQSASHRREMRYS
jgi:hypothetical protein